MPSIADLGLDDQNRTQVQVTVLMVAKETGEDILRALATNFTKHGVMVKGSLDVTHVYYKAYAKRVDKRTVYGLYLRLTELVYMPMFTNLDNTATLKVTNELVLTVRNIFFSTTILFSYFCSRYVSSYHCCCCCCDVVVVAAAAVFLPHF